MKIVCGACGAKYSIADEKVQGKVFKIRCKKCSNVIVVKGDDDGADQTLTNNTSAAEWYVVVDGDQVGPISVEEVESYFAAGRVNSESFAWKDGLADWVPLSVLEEFAHLGADSAGPEETTQISDNFGHYQAQINQDADVDATSVMTTGGLGTGSTPSGDDMFSDFGGAGDYPSEGYGGDSSAYSDDGYGGGSFEPSSFSSFGAETASQDSSYGDSASSSSGGGMFASFDSPAPSKSSNDDDFLGFTSPEPSPSASPSSSAGSAAVLNDDMIGKRNENSVLFSLSSLDQVQAVSGSAPKSDDVPVTDGSGLIDIRALASAHKSMKSGGDDSAPSVDPFTTGTMAMPALMPMGSHRSNTPMIIGGVVGLVVLLAFGGVLAYLLTKDSGQPQQIIEKEVIVREVVRESGDDAKAAEDAKAADEAAKAAMEEPAAGEGEGEEKVAAKSDSSKSSKRTTSRAEKTETKDPEPVAAAAPAKKSGDNIDNLLAQLDSKEEPKKAVKKEAPKATSAPSSGGKTSLSKDDVQGVIRANSGRISTCYRSQNSGKLSGTMRVKFNIKPNGRVSNAEILTGSFAGTDVGACVQKAVRGMRFPATSASDDLPITYPFKLE